jgi:hypothetical protein
MTQLDFTYNDKQCCIMKHVYKGVTRYNSYIISYKSWQKTVFEHVGTSETQIQAFELIKGKVKSK